MSIANKVILIGRLTKDPELRKTQSDKSVLSFTVAVNRPYNKENDHPEADFFNCTAWEQRADFISKWFHKGDEIRLCGRLQNREYERDDGQKVRLTEVIVEEAEFGQKKRDASDGERQQETRKPASAPKSQPVEDEPDELPFN